MNIKLDSEFVISCFQELVNIPSPVGYYREMNPVVEKYASMFGKSAAFDNKSTAYITFDGEDNSKTVLVGAHLDTIGLVVRKIDADGMIRVHALGGISFSSIEGETVTIHTREGKKYTGLMACQSHSVHVFDDARTMARDEQHMMVILDENVKSKQDVVNLGIRNGDTISIDPRCQVTENGYIKSRFIDDKMAVAISFAAMKYLTEHCLKPKYRTMFALPYGEEIGIGGAYIPEEVSEFVAIDIGLIGPDLDGNERSVSICVKDYVTTYDYDLTTQLIEIARRNEIAHAVDIFNRYATDAGAALKGGNDLKIAAFGMAVYCSHGMERTHIDGVNETTALLLAYLLGM